MPSITEDRVRVWTVVIDNRPDSTASFPDLDDALAYLRGDISTNGSSRAELTSELLSAAEYVSVAEAQDAPPDDVAWTGAEL